jgi:REP element-mobilizing transposase RayT
VTTRFPVRRKIRLADSVYQAGLCFFTTIATHGRHPWFSMYPDFAGEVAASIESMAERPRTYLYAWCVMPDHVHLLLQDADIVEFVRLLKGRATPMARRYEKGRRLWQRSFFDHALRREESVPVVAQYVFENPVRAQLVATPPDYKWSGSSVWPHWRESYRGRG